MRLGCTSSLVEFVWVAAVSMQRIFLVVCVLHWLLAVFVDLVNTIFFLLNIFLIYIYIYIYV